MRKRYVEEGLPWPGQERKLDGRQEAHLIGAAPEGQLELEFAESISLETTQALEVR